MHRRLPHVDGGHMQHIVFCTKGAFSGLVVDGGPDRVERADAQLDASPRGRILEGRAADAVADVLLYGAVDQYELHAWCVMPNHVHVLVQPRGTALRLIVQRWKSISARRINALLGKEGAVWQPNYFDSFMRDDEQPSNTANYIEHSPVTAKLVRSPEDWPWSSAARR